MAGSTPEGVPWMIFSALKAILKMSSFDLSRSNRDNRAAADATETAADDPRPAAIGIEDSISMFTPFFK